MPSLTTLDARIGKSASFIRIEFIESVVEVVVSGRHRVETQVVQQTDDALAFRQTGEVRAVNVSPASSTSTMSSCASFIAVIIAL